MPAEDTQNIKTELRTKLLTVVESFETLFFWGSNPTTMLFPTLSFGGIKRFLLFNKGTTHDPPAQHHLSGQGTGNCSQLDENLLGQSRA